MMQKIRGFSLLEAIVAIVLISSSGIALYGWINSSLMSVNRVRDVMVEQRVVRETLPFVQTINPMLLSNGYKRLGKYEISWSSTLMEPPQDGVDFPAGLSIYQLGLYNLQVTVKIEDDFFSYEIRQVGFQKVRELPDA